MKNIEKHINDLYEAIIKVETVEDCKALLDDLCT